MLEVSEQRWNRGPDRIHGITHDRAKSGFLNEGRGHQKIGVARSTDLVTFEVPEASDGAPSRREFSGSPSIPGHLVRRFE